MEGRNDPEGYLPFETFPLGDTPSQFLLTYIPEPASPTEKLLSFRT
jgi:hypothetical protein